jgi:phosphoserine phosphatase
MSAAPPFAAVWFDCDSTLSSIEGVDELFGTLPAALRAEFVALTQQAMEGTLPLEQVYATRLQRLAPHRDQLARIGELYVAHAVPDAGPVVAALRALGKHVGILSGGLLSPVQRLATHLGIDLANVRAVPLLFAADGSYRDFDRGSRLWRNGGKVEELRALPASHRPLAFVGDGATDLETQGTADLFIGYGGVAVRPKVKAAAEAWFETTSLAPVLRFLLTDAERQRLAAEPAFASLLSRAYA